MIRLQLSLSAALLSLVTPSFAQWSDDPAVNLAVADAASDQILPKLVPTVDGGAWVSWYDGIANGFDVRVQKLDLLGHEVFPHNGLLVADRSFSSVQDYGHDLAADGSSLTAFRDDSGTGIQITANKVSAAGALDWGAAGIQLTSTTDFVAAPKIAGTADGGAVVAWTQDADVVLQKLDVTGAPQWGPGVTLTPATGAYSVSDLHAAEDSVIVSFVFQSGGFGSPRHLLAQKLDASGALQWGAGHVAVFDGGSLQFGNFPTFVSDGAGGGVFAWYSSSPSLQVYAQHVLSNGTEAYPHNGALPSSDASRIRVNPSVAYDEAADEAVVFWVEENTGQSQFGVYGQKLDGNGDRLWSSEGEVVVPIGATQITQVRTLAVSGGALTFWDAAPSFATDQLHGARLDAAGTITVAPFDVASTPSQKLRLAAARSASGFAILAWSDQRTDSGDVYAQNVRAGGALGSDVATPYCFGVGCPCGNDDPLAGCANSLGSGALLAATAGSASVTLDDLVLSVTGIQPGQFGLIFMGGAQTSVPFGDGLRCVAGGATALNRFPVRQADGAGAFGEGPGIVAHSLATFPPAGHITAGLTAFFAGWYRDPLGLCGNAFNLTNAAAVGFTP